MNHRSLQRQALTPTLPGDTGGPRRCEQHVNSGTVFQSQGQAVSAGGAMGTLRCLWPGAFKEPRLTDAAEQVLQPARCICSRHRPVLCTLVTMHPAASIRVHIAGQRLRSCICSRYSTITFAMCCLQSHQLPLLSKSSAFFCRQTSASCTCKCICAPATPTAAPPDV